MGEFFVSIVKVIVAVVVINLLASFVYTRFDLTEDKRYTISEPAVAVAQKFETPVIVDVLLDGNIPAEFSKLKTETIQLLESFGSKNSNIKYNLVDPLEDSEDLEETIAQLQSLGLQPANVTVEENGKVSNELVFPWAMVNYNDQTVKVPLLKNKLGSTAEERINNSVQQLEYAFADAFTKLSIEEKKSIAVIKGNGELDDIFIADYLTTIRDYYNIGAITLDSVSSDPQNVFNQLKGFDLAIIAKPTEAFTDQEKYVMDQYMVQGGKSIWMMDQVNMEMDSIYAGGGKAIAVPRDLNLKDMFFKYGVRINPVLVNDLYFTQIVLATGEGNDSQYNPLPWFYYPMVFSQNNHPINTNIEAVRFQFASPMDVLENDYEKTILLQSSPLSKTDGIPRVVSLDMINQQPDRELYNNGKQPLAVLIEGNFTSMYQNRVKPLKLQNTMEEGPENKMIVISDGDIIKNQLRKGRPLELGYDKWTNSFYGNKEFLVNSTNYLLDNSGLINIRNKKVSIPLLDVKKIAEHKTKWQLVNIGLPVVLTLLFGLFFSYYRKRKFTA
ncbi:gliding motility-associated ABC transporter substrate-binding protein GldG [Flagellimonas halotolerans]|uniref:Gliding motility-associated ABC transporter substrate-binding protein GldG n=1 Tax=Flagellimonas halotolerans TaxID=3112164 RepID=A0ABU6IV33_9FLAO|nr:MULTISPECIES: gliding motility-associated ABC transporter substrate-binding protein GldG [unclassified Allomuricauda]MEC3966859.1 gliding motility-associated ABC transporter substrate-binding protein GldG [Muricauda sp. SYSU M86414]MEC4266735.1 gliding motility-associated ABC transporter substrate-binding protein GldG [Muricauda sp. SYSU M84420]